MNKQTHSFYKNFDDLQSRIAHLKSVKNLKKNCSLKICKELEEEI